MVESRVLLPVIKSLHERIRDRVIRASSEQSSEELARVAEDGEGDTIFAIDRVSEEELVRFFEFERLGDPVVLIAEGLRGGSLILPKGADERAAAWRVIVDPIDGTRCIMYQKRSGWILTALAPDRGDRTSLADIEIAVQTEIPLAKQHLMDQLWAVRGEGVEAERIDRFTGERTKIHPRPSTAATLAHGCVSICRFFPGARDLLGQIDEEMHRRVFERLPERKALTFDDQYPCTGGQLYGLVMGQDRFVADLRPLTRIALERRGDPRAFCCHPYDICTKLIAEEAGVLVTDPHGRPLDGPLDVDADIAWVGYANEAIRRQIEPVLQEVLREHGLLEIAS